MKIILVRHGHPDYVNDCLTPLGHEQAAKAALRLKNEGIEKILRRTTELNTNEKEPFVYCNYFMKIPRNVRKSWNMFVIKSCFIVPIYWKIVYDLVYIDRILYTMTICPRKVKSPKENEQQW